MTSSSTSPAGRWRIGFDIGGTFTDFILHDAQRSEITLHKRLTSPHDPSEAALLGLWERHTEKPDDHPAMLTACREFATAHAEDPLLPVRLRHTQPLVRLRRVSPNSATPPGRDTP